MSEAKARVAVKEVKNAVQYSDGTILLKNVRASHPYVFKAQENKNEKGEITGHTYSIVGLMDKMTHDEAKKLVVAAINALLKESNKGEKIPSDKKFLKDGDPKDEDDAGKPETAGMWTVSTRERNKPKVLHKFKDKATGKARRLTDEDADVIYGGCYVNMLIRPWFQNNNYGKRVNAGISVVQFVSDGEPFGSGRITDDDVDDTFEGASDEEEVEEDDDEPL